MDDDRAYSLRAPGRDGSGAALRLPGRGSFPGVDDHLVEPEVTRDEIVGGRRVIASPAKLPHATQHFELDYLLRAHVAPGYGGATDLLTRHGEEADFASDACVFRDGVDPATGGRFLEEIAFEVVSEQNEREAAEKARSMHQRGVRRIFALLVKGRRQVCEWSPARQEWTPLAPDARIEDPCLVAPLAVAALLDAAAADNAVVEALAAKGNPAIRQREAAAEARGRAAGKAEDIVQVLEARGIAVSAAEREEILRCRDLARLDRWLRRAALASSTAEVLAEL
jgi:hypothetical protein